MRIGLEMEDFGLEREREVMRVLEEREREIGKKKGFYPYIRM